MHPTRLAPWTALLTLLALALLVPVTPARVAAPLPEEAPPVKMCWNIKTTICTDCAISDSKYCDPRSANGPFASCLQTTIEPCPGFTCADVQAELGPPCN
jgi:hypothetical protein